MCGEVCPTWQLMHGSRRKRWGCTVCTNFLYKFDCCILLSSSSCTQTKRLLYFFSAFLWLDIYIIICPCFASFIHIVRLITTIVRAVCTGKMQSLSNVPRWWRRHKVPWERFTNLITVIANQNDYSRTGLKRLTWFQTWNPVFYHRRLWGENFLLPASTLTPSLHPLRSSLGIRISQKAGIVWSQHFSRSMPRENDYWMRGMTGLLAILDSAKWNPQVHNSWPHISARPEW